MKKKLDINSPEYRDLVRNLTTTKINLPPLQSLQISSRPLPPLHVQQIPMIPTSPLPSLSDLPKTNFLNLPKDVRKLVIYEMDPKDALTVCMSQIGFECDWQKLLDLNYDFVTQGFAPFTDAKQKFRYLAERVSKNINTINPEIIFVHFGGVPLGKKRFLQAVLEDFESEIYEKENDMRSILKTIKKSGAVEWIRQDDHNSWIKVLNKNKLPKEIQGEINGSGGTRHRKIIRDVDLYDYPGDRQKRVGNEYPGKFDLLSRQPINKADLFKTLQNMINKFLTLGAFVVGDEEDEKEELKEQLENLNSEVGDFFLEGMLNDKTTEYAVYTMMLEGFTRTEAELFIRSYDKDKLFTDNLKKLYGFDVYVMM